MPSTVNNGSSSLSSQPKEASKDVPNNNHVKDLFSFIHKYSVGDEYKKLKEIDKENENLKKQNHDLRTTNDTNLQTLALHQLDWNAEREKFQQQLKIEKDEQLREREEKEAATTKVCEQKKLVNSLRSQISNYEGEIQRLIKTSKNQEHLVLRLEKMNKNQTKDLEEVGRNQDRISKELAIKAAQLEQRTSELSIVQQSLKNVDSMVVHLESLDGKMQEVHEALGDMFKTALEFFEAHLGQGCLDPDSLHRGNSNVNDIIRPPLPLPCSDTPAAKRMRVVAGLIILVKYLADHIFRRTYISCDGELEDILRVLASHNPIQEAYLQAVLLKALPERHKDNQQQSAARVAQKVANVLKPWISENRAETFEAGLGQVCDKICQIWATIQFLDETIRPEFSYHLQEDWKPFPDLAVRSDSTPKPSGQSQQKQPKQNNRQHKTARQGPAPAPAPSPALQLSHDDKMALVVWPAFLATDLHHPVDAEAPMPDLVHPGFILTQAQIKDAEEEVSQRNARRALRRGESRSEKKQRQGSITFLSDVGLGGSDVK